jgi:WD40 repeat protein
VLWPLEFSHDGRFLAAGESQSTGVRVWDLDRPDQKEQQLACYGSALEEHVIGLAFSSVGGLLASCTSGGVLTVWRLQDDGVWKRVHASRRHDVTALAFFPDGQTLVLGRRRCSLDFKDVSTWKCRCSIQGRGLPEEKIRFLHQGATPVQLVLITGTEDRNHGIDSNHVLRLLDLATSREERTLRFPFVIWRVAPSPCGRYLAWIVRDQQHSPSEITFFDLKTWQELGRLEWDPEDPLRDLDFSPDGHTLVTGSAAGVVKFWPWRLLLEG